MRRTEKKKREKGRKESPTNRASYAHRACMQTWINKCAGVYECAARLKECRTYLGKIQDILIHHCRAIERKRGHRIPEMQRSQ